MAAGVFVGLATIDLIYAVESLPPPNTKALAQSQELFVGGPATNAAITFGHLGSTAALEAAVGRHPIASIIKDELARYSIELVDLTPDDDELPAISSVWVDRQGRRSVVSVNTTRLTNRSPRVDAGILANARILLVDGHSMEACQAWARAARSSGVPVVLDGGSWKTGTDELLRFVDAAICSADFLPPGCSGEDDVIQYLETCGVKHIAITHGAGPIRFLSGSSAGMIAVPQVDVVDTTGAGDVLHGTFCYYSVAGYDFADSLREAAKVASESCRYAGTRRWMQRD
jgi:sugar/nucleoside kinase (ribokinase family)